MIYDIVTNAANSLGILQSALYGTGYLIKSKRGYDDTETWAKANSCEIYSPVADLTMSIVSSALCRALRVPSAST